ncbi:type 1 fimbrial protein [Serratia plymuthica]|uniref:Exotoxin n=1 Tax=Serratia plymuthica S13 TaxID=1348660 RepID=S4YKP0_SERPL|nr:MULTISPECIES: fimbrial protein [Serratia]AGP43368.1 exotoxin [Serratia plymuthica S13]AHY06099.1 exotoxin [Serratia plymuthica]ANS41594.1 putative fimbrial-like protein YfcP [Serratia inhibens PRI-2C]KYG14950.1 Fimbrial adapter PapK precursor [Serratia plymuthica]KYG15838.1 Fimbrial adapter PapK precursor [Serratia plymuthica]
MVNKMTWCATAALLLCSQLSLAAENMRLHGALVAEPCVIPPGDETVVLDFDTVIDKYLYLNTRTPGQPFELHLAQCDLSLGKTVRVTFSGNESAALPGLLALNGGSQASGIAIGMETAQGESLPINQQGKAQALVSGANILTAQAYVQGEPDALKHKAIERGPFSAVVTFSLEYE